MHKKTQSWSLSSASAPERSASCNLLCATLKMSDKIDPELDGLECLYTWQVEIDSGSHRKIRQNLLEKVQQSPLHYQATYFNILAFVLHLEGETEMALEYLCKAEEALKEDKRDETDFIVTYSSFAWIHHHLRNQKDMERYRDKVRSISREGAAATVHGEKGWSFLKLGSMFFERSKESFEKALELNPENPSYNMGYGVVLYRIEDLDKKHEIKPEYSAAVKQLRKTLSLDSGYSEAMTLLALKVQKYDEREADELIVKALVLSPDVPHIIAYVDTYLRFISSNKRLLEILKSALFQTPTSVFLNHQAGLCYKKKYMQLIKSGRRDEAAADVKECIRFLSEAVRLDPSNTNAMMNLAEAYAEDHQLQKAIDIFKKALVQSPNSDILNHQTGLCYMKKYIQLIKSGRRDEAAAHVKKCIRFLSEAVRLDPSNTNAMMNLAEAYAEDHQLQRAEETFTNLIKECQLKEKDKQHCHFIYGKFLFFKRNDEDRSVEQYKEAYKIQVYSGDRKKAGERLRQVARHKRGQMSNEIWAFLADEDEKSNKGGDLASEFSQKVQL
ncbi:interferon-induced protein with tetratricopeptide repeats 1-like [Denticeps clupeoides]|nr:interferon-induced protein with tetratricopeptide repeats 1-like [Denticeps clupeoides]